MNTECKKSAPFPVLGATFFVLIIVTVLQIFAGRIDFENYNQVLLPLPVNLIYMNDIIVFAAAGIQAVLIAAVCMGLCYQKPVYTMVFLAGALCIVIFLALTFSDALFRGEVDKLEALRPVPVEKVDTP